MNIKNMKKTAVAILITFVCSLLMVLPISADSTEVSISLADVRQGILTVSGTIDGAKEGDPVAILVMNPGYEPDDAEENELAAQHQYVAFTNADGYFTHSFRLLVGESFEMASFPVYVYNKNFSKPFGEEFFYSSFPKLLEYAKTIYEKVTSDGIDDNTAEGKELRKKTAEYLENSAKLLAVDSRFYSVSSENIVKGLVEYFAENKVDFGSEDEAEEVREEKEKAGIEKIIAQINRYAVFSAFNEGKGELVFDSANNIIVDGMLGLTDMISANTTLDKVLSGIDREGVAGINAGLLENNITSESELAAIYAKNIILYGIKNNTQNGWGYVSDILTKQNADYAGLDIKEYLALGSADKTNADIIDSKASLTLANLESKIKEYALKNTSTQNNTPSYGGGSGGSGGSSGGGGGGISVGAPVTSTKQQETTSVPKEVFSDIASYSWAKEAIIYLADKKIINGTGDGTFKPMDILTREQAVKIICLACGLDAEKADNAAFDDETDGAWYQNYLAIARGNGIINGTGENYFGIGNAVSREEFVTMLFRAVKAEENELAVDFVDGADVSDFAKGAVAYFANRKIVNGYDDGTFRPGASISRAEAAKLVYELIRKGDK